MNSQRMCVLGVGALMMFAMALIAMPKQGVPATVSPVQSSSGFSPLIEVVPPSIAPRRPVVAPRLPGIRPALREAHKPARGERKAMMVV